MIVAALLTLALAAEPDPAKPAPVDITAAHKPAAKADSFKDPDRIICRREEVVGSHRPQKICMTKHEWDVTEDQSRNALRDGGIQAIAKPCDGPCTGATGGLVGGVSMGPR